MYFLPMFVAWTIVILINVAYMLLKNLDAATSLEKSTAEPIGSKLSKPDSRPEQSKANKTKSEDSRKEFCLCPETDISRNENDQKPNDNTTSRNGRFEGDNESDDYNAYARNIKSDRRSTKYSEGSNGTANPSHTSGYVKKFINGKSAVSIFTSHACKCSDSFEENLLRTASKMLDTENELEAHRIFKESLDKRCKTPDKSLLSEDLLGSKTESGDNNTERKLSSTKTISRPKTPRMSPVPYTMPPIKSIQFSGLSEEVTVKKPCIRCTNQPSKTPPTQDTLTQTSRSFSKKPCSCNGDGTAQETSKLHAQITVSVPKDNRTDGVDELFCSNKVGVRRVQSIDASTSFIKIALEDGAAQTSDVILEERRSSGATEGVCVAYDPEKELLLQEVLVGLMTLRTLVQENGGDGEEKEDMTMTPPDLSLSIIKAIKEVQSKLAKMIDDLSKEIKEISICTAVKGSGNPAESSNKKQTSKSGNALHLNVKEKDVTSRKYNVQVQMREKPRCAGNIETESRNANLSNASKKPSFEQKPKLKKSSMPLQTPTQIKKCSNINCPKRNK